jgi:cysteine-rich repeat protein
MLALMFPSLMGGVVSLRTFAWLNVLFVVVAASGCKDEQVVVRDLGSTCGNGTLETDEGCDDGNTIATDACTSACHMANCGDGITRADLQADQEGFEACDDGNDVDTDACRLACVLASCGDGVVRTDLSEGEAGFEACDDGNRINTDGCSSTCASESPDADRDGDGIPDLTDNCPDVANADQADGDGDGTGDACDPNPERRDYKLRAGRINAINAVGEGGERRQQGRGLGAASPQGETTRFQLKGGFRATP